MRDDPDRHRRARCPAASARRPHLCHRRGPSARASRPRLAGAKRCFHDRIHAGAYINKPRLLAHHQRHPLLSPSRPGSACAGRARGSTMTWRACRDHHPGHALHPLLPGCRYQPADAESRFRPLHRQDLPVRGLRDRARCLRGRQAAGTVVELAGDDGLDQDPPQHRRLLPLGHTNFNNEMYTYTGPNNDIALNCFRIDLADEGRAALGGPRRCPHGGGVAARIRPRCSPSSFATINNATMQDGST